ncbi:helicase domain-containing protein [mine drainage metagenome]|uniref:Helicase domain-containing protein n=1 Tax=mine drainage metagenome TaxID=410659 RepID=T1CEC9_9ZZZZ
MGRPAGARFRTYERLKAYANGVKGTLDDAPELHSAIDDIYRLPLRESTTDTLNRQLRSGATDQELALIVMSLREEGRLSAADKDTERGEPRILCSLGLVAAS